MQMKEFIIKFLNIEERHYADTLISMRMCEDLLQSWDEHRANQTIDVIDSGKIVASYNQETKDWTIKYSNQPHDTTQHPIR